MPDIVIPIAAQPLTTPIKLFMVEDSASDRYTYIRYLRAEKSLDYHIVEAETLEEGLSLWQSFQSGIYSSQLLQIALVDINLPDGNGLASSMGSPTLYRQVSDGMKVELIEWLNAAKINKKCYYLDKAIKNLIAIRVDFLPVRCLISL